VGPDPASLSRDPDRVAAFPVDGPDELVHVRDVRLELDEEGASAHARVERRAAVEHAVDAVRDRFGSTAVGPASLVERNIPKDSPEPEHT